MLISFDPEKDELTRSQRGLSLALGAEIIGNAVLTVLDDRRDYGEDRFVSFGYVGERLHVRVFTLRDTTHHIISVRKGMKGIARLADNFDIDDNPEWTDRNTRVLDEAAKLKRSHARLEMTQADFAALLGIPLATQQNWEQRRTGPDPIATTLIDLVFDDPKDMRLRLMRRNAA